MVRGEISGVTFELALADSPRVLALRGDSITALGFPVEDFLAQHILLSKRIHPSDTDLADQIFDADARPECGSMCLRVRHADGHIRCFQADFRKSGPAGDRRLELHLQDAKELWRAGKADDSDNLRAAIENTKMAIFFKDRNHVYTAASPAFRSAVGKWLDGRDPIGLTDYDFLPEGEADPYYAIEKRVMTENETVEEIREIVREGKLSWIEILEHPVQSVSGEVTGLFATALNLTRRIRAEEQVYTANESLPETEKLPPIGSYLLDIQRGAFAVSASIDAMLGLEPTYPHDLDGWMRLIHPADAAAMMEYIEGVIATPGRIFNREYRVVRPNDGEVRWVQGLGRVERDRKGTPLLMRGSVQDITQRKATEAALRETTKRLELFIEHAPAALAMYDRDMRYLAVSRRWRELYRVGEEVVGRCHYDVVTDIPERWKEAHTRGLAGESLSCEEDRFERADGSVLWIRWELMPWRADDDTVGGILVFVEDITERKRSQQRLELAASVFADASEAIFVTDLSGNIIEVNDAFTRITGYGREEVLGQHSHLLKSERHDEDFYTELAKEVVAIGRWRGEQWFRRRDGGDIQVSATITTVFDGNGKPAHFVGLFFDVTPIKEQERKLEQAVHYDELTGLPNRTLVLERLRGAIAGVSQSGQMVGMILFDLDNFKAVNEAHGRAAADALLLSVAGRMKQVLRHDDTLGRIGGDEFIVVLPDLTDAAEATQVTERLLDAVGGPVTLGSALLQVSATAGVTFYPQAEEVDADQMVRQCVQAMYEAKLAGKARFHVFDPARDYSVRGKLEEIGRIRQALKAGEFVLHYQPKVNMATGALLGTEGLIRWQHPQRGLLLPGAFLPVIEDHELAIGVGEWVIGEALRQIGAWNREGHPIAVSVNVSARHLQEKDFVDKLRGLLQANPDADPACLELEILETSTLEDIAHVSDIIAACLEMGTQVAIDDFGTGYSSLSYLKRLPAPVLKLDQTFVRAMMEDPDDLAILQGVMGLASAFRRTVVAEGVETVEQGLMLLRMGCTHAQGYGIARPMPADEVVTWYNHWWPDPRWREAEPVNPQNWPMLVAQVELSHWMRSLERYIRGLEPEPPELDESRSRFGAWLHSERAGSLGALPVFLRLEKMQQEMHAAARGAVLSKRNGEGGRASASAHTSVIVGRQIEKELGRLLMRGTPPHGTADIAVAVKAAHPAR